MLRFAPLFFGGLQIVTMEGHIFLQRTVKPELFFLSKSLISLACHQISQCRTFSRDMPGLLSLAILSYLPSQKGFSSKDWAPCSNSMRPIGEVQERGDTPFSAQLQWPLEQPKQKLLPQAKETQLPQPTERKSIGSP